MESQGYTAAQAAEDYEKHMREILQKAPNTIRGATQAINRFLAMHPTTLETGEFTADLFGAYQTDKFSELAQTTRNLQIGHLKRWLRYLLEEGRLGADLTPWRKMVPTKNPKRKRAKAFIREGDKLPALVKAAREWHERDAVYFLISYWTKKRVSEIVRMRVSDIDFAKRPNATYGVFGFEQVKINGEKQYLPIPKPLAPILKEWLETYAELIERKLVQTDYLIPALHPGSAQSRKGVRMPMVLVPTKQLPYDSAHDIIDRAFKTAGIQRAEGEGTHGLRRGGLDDLIRKAGEQGIPNPMRLAKTAAGHGDERTTENYTDNYKDTWDLGKAQDQMYGDPVAPAAAVPETAAEGATVLSLTDRLNRRNRTA